MPASSVQYEEPGSISEALEVMARAGAGARFLAGGTDVLPRLRKGLIPRPDALINIKRIPDLRGIRLDAAAAEVVVGAAATFSEILESTLLAERLPLMPAVSDLIASPQIRNMATIGGNVCNASPAGDMILPLIVYGARARAWSLSGGEAASRDVMVQDLFSGPGATVLEPGELLGSLHVPLPADGFKAAFRKFRRRPTMDCAVVHVAAGAVVGDGGALSGVRVAYGAVAPTPLRGTRAEAALEGKTLDDATLDAAGKAAAAEVKPIDDVRAGAEFREQIVPVLLGRALREVVE